MIQIEIIEKETEQELVNDVNYFLEQLENHLFVDIKYSSNIYQMNKEIKKNFTAMIIYRVE